MTRFPSNYGRKRWGALSLERRAGFPITNVADANVVAGNSGDWRTLCLDALLSASFFKSVTE